MESHEGPKTRKQHPSAQLQRNTKHLQCTLALSPYCHPQTASLTAISKLARANCTERRSFSAALTRYGLSRIRASLLARLHSSYLWCNLVYLELSIKSGSLQATEPRLGQGVCKLGGHVPGRPHPLAGSRLGVLALLPMCCSMSFVTWDQSPPMLRPWYCHASFIFWAWARLD